MGWVLGDREAQTGGFGSTGLQDQGAIIFLAGVSTGRAEVPSAG